MIKKNVVKPAILLFVALFTLALAATSWAQCVADNDNLTNGIQQQTLYGGQTIEAGTVSVQIVGDDLVVYYETTGGWQLVETHLWVGEDIAEMPQTKKGNPKIGNFPYNSGDIAGTTDYSVAIPLNVLGFSCPSDATIYYVAAHAALQKVDGAGNVVQTETGWADGDRFVEKGMWGTYFSVTLTCNCDTEPEEPPAACETAFSKGDTCFLNMDFDGDGSGDFNRWGWNHGPLGAGSYKFPIYAGAGQCDTSKGTLVGNLTVVYGGSMATVTFSMDAGFTMEETHLYVGSDPLARDVTGDYTVAPGQYGNIHDLSSATSDTFTITGLSGDIYVVAHAVACGSF